MQENKYMGWLQKHILKTPQRFKGLYLSNRYMFVCNEFWHNSPLNILLLILFYVYKDTKQQFAS